jgi:hypothetical protein
LFLFSVRASSTPSPILQSAFCVICVVGCDNGVEDGICVGIVDDGTVGVLVGLGLGIDVAVEDGFGVGVGVLVGVAVDVAEDVGVGVGVLVLVGVNVGVDVAVIATATAVASAGCVALVSNGGLHATINVRLNTTSAIDFIFHCSCC